MLRSPPCRWTNVAARYLDDEVRFVAAVEKGVAPAERGESIEEEEMDARPEAMFRPKCASVRLRGHQEAISNSTTSE